MGIALVWGCLRGYYVPSSSFAHHPHLCLLSLGVVLPVNVTAIQALVLEEGNHFLHVSLSSHSLRFNSLLPALSQKALGLLRGQVLKVLIVIFVNESIDEHRHSFVGGLHLLPETLDLPCALENVEGPPGPHVEAA